MLSLLLYLVVVSSSGNNAYAPISLTNQTPTYVGQLQYASDTNLLQRSTTSSQQCQQNQHCQAPPDYVQPNSKSEILQIVVIDNLEPKQDLDPLANECDNIPGPTLHQSRRLLIKFQAIAWSVGVWTRMANNRAATAAH